MTRQKANTLMARMMGLIDRVLPPESRREFVKNCSDLANDRPLLAVWHFPPPLPFSFSPKFTHGYQAR